MPKKPNKIGVLLCNCGTNIADNVDMEAVSNWAKGNEKVAFVASHDLLCSPEGKKYFQELIKKKKVDNLVIAACSPHMHGATFQDIALQSESNVAKVHMANIREQAAWVTPDMNDATAKSITLINAAIERSLLHEQIKPKYMDCKTDVVIIGGGVAGIEAALLAAQADRKVTLIEKEISVGGRVMQVEEMAPNMECAACLMAPRLSKLKDQPNITVLAPAEVLDIRGFFGNYQVRVQKKARYVNAECIGCEACFEACPVSVPSLFHLGMGTHKAIYTQFPGSVPQMAAIDAKHCLHFKDGSCHACVEACPFAAIDFEEKEELLEIPAGAVILAIGSQLYQGDDLKRLGYPTLENVYTLPEFERLACSNGPTQGEIQSRQKEKPNSIAVIHCAGSLSEQGLEYCSGPCCLTALKVGELLRKQSPQAKVINIHNRLVIQGTEAEAFLQKQSKEGTRLLHTADLNQTKVTRAGKQLMVTTAEGTNIIVDMVVLATGLSPSRDTGLFAEFTHAEPSAQGFYSPEQAHLKAHGTTIDGFYAVGGCKTPSLTAQAVNQAQAAAGEIVSRLVPGRKIPLEPMTTVIDDQACAGCKLCIAVCPYHAIEYDSKKKVSRVNEAICRGCGTCAANCPTHAACAKHYTNDQIMAELEGVMHED
jgi:heterodisulfide reductase subunit A2